MSLEGWANKRASEEGQGRCHLISCNLEEYFLMGIGSAFWGPYVSSLNLRLLQLELNFQPNSETDWPKLMWYCFPKLYYFHFLMLMVLPRAAQTLEAGLCSVSQSKKVRVHWCITYGPEFPPGNTGCLVDRTHSSAQSRHPWLCL